MRALTVRQPWAWAIVHGGKDVENRTRNLAGSYRGPVAIHAGMTYDVTAYASDAWPPHTRTSNPDKLVRGAIIGVVDLDGVHHASECDSGDGGRCSRWAEPGGVWHLRVVNPRPVSEPIPARGVLGLWRPDRNLEERIRARVNLAT